MDRQTLGERIRAMRELRGLSQQQVARAFGCARETVSNWERGERGIEAPELARLARVFDVDITYFYGAGEYQTDDVPPELQMVYGLQGRVMSHLPPGRARERYIASLRAQAESNWALIEGRLEDEEGREADRGEADTKEEDRRQKTEDGKEEERCVGEEEEGARKAEPGGRKEETGAGEPNTKAVRERRGARATGKAQGGSKSKTREQ